MSAPETQPPRAGEELPIDRLAPYLREALGAPGAEVKVSQFPGGHSNLTYLVTVGERELVLRRPPFGSTVKTAHDMGREYKVLSRLAPVFSRAPRPALECTDPSVIGAPFYAMERRSGIILRRQMGPELKIDSGLARRMSEGLVDGLIELHALDYQKIGLGDFGRPDGYVERQLGGWSKRYVDSRTEDIPEMEALAVWLRERIPASAPPTILHNDYKYDNVILDPEDLGRVTTILDWEMATIGDPLMDLGTLLCYWIDAADIAEMRAQAFGPTAIPGSLTRREVAARYGEKTGWNLENVEWYYRFGLFKTAVIVQQIYYRWFKGVTKDQRFSTMNQNVLAMARQAMVEGRKW